jgi:hypothetical protein
MTTHPQNTRILDAILLSGQTGRITLNIGGGSVRIEAPTSGNVSPSRNRAPLSWAKTNVSKNDACCQIPASATTA